MTQTLGTVKVRQLSPELVQDYLQFFDIAFDDFPDWAGCYCGFYDTPATEREWDASESAASEHRIARAERIQSGQATGFLAYYDGRVVGWCNAQPRAQYRNMRRFQVAVTDTTESVGSIMCFLVSQVHRNKGVGTALLNAACESFKQQGLRVAEAYPSTAQLNPASKLPWDEAYYKGPLSMYLKAGFKIHMQHDRFAIVRKQL